MLSPNARYVAVLLGLWAIIGIVGCSGGGTPTVPGSEATVTTAQATFAGTLTDSNGDPLAWAEVWIDGEIAGWTDEDGSITVYGIDSVGPLQIEARIDDEVVYTGTVQTGERSAQQFGDEDPNIDRGTVWGFVHDQLGPVPHALVVVFNHSENFGADFTGENGYYNIPDAPAGLCMVLAFAPEHATAKYQVFILPGGEVQKNLFLPQKLDFGLVGGVVLTGPIGDVKPVPFARIDLQPINVPDAQKISAFTNKHGVYMFPPIPLGLHELWANAPCMNEGHRVWDVHPGRNVVNFHLEPAGCGGVEGQVSNPDGLPIPGALVRLIHPNPDGGPPFVLIGFSGPNGHYRIDPVPPGEFALECEKPSFELYVHDAPVLVFPDQFAVVDISLVPNDE